MSSLACLCFVFLLSDTNKALHFYSHDNARTTRGVLNITTEQKVNSYMAFNEKTKKFYADKKHVQSAMLQSWNKFCFIGGIIEFSAKLPGYPDKGGLWPARTYIFLSCPFPNVGPPTSSRLLDLVRCCILDHASMDVRKLGESVLRGLV